PADDRFLDEHLVDGAQLETALGEIAEFLDVVSDAAADAAERERRPDDDREAERPREIDRFRQRSCQAAVGNVEADFPHRLLEQLAVLGNLDGLDRRTNQLDLELIERAAVREVDR